MLKNDSARKGASRITALVKDFIELKKDDDPISHLRHAGLQSLLSPRDTTSQLPVGHVTPPKPVGGLKNYTKTELELDDSESEMETDED